MATKIKNCYYLSDINTRLDNTCSSFDLTTYRKKHWKVNLLALQNIKFNIVIPRRLPNNHDRSFSPVS